MYRNYEKNNLSFLKIVCNLTPPPIVVQERKLVDMPWHKIQTDQETPLIAGAPTKRTPIKGNYSLILAVTLFMQVT